MASEFPDIPPDMRKVYRRLKRWRSAHVGGSPIPEPLWGQRPNWLGSMRLTPPRRLYIWSMAS